MKPVELQDIATLAAERPALILHKDAMGFSYIDMLVHRCPNFVASKQNHTVFPLEIWEMIIAFGMEWTRQDYTDYILVRLERIVRVPGYPEGQGDYLICKPIPDHIRIPCGKLQNPWEIAMYEDFLDCPEENGCLRVDAKGCNWFQVLSDGEGSEEEEDTSSSEEEEDTSGSSDEDRDDDEGSDINTAHKAGGQSDISVRILLSTLSGDIKTLFTDITVPDVIGWVEKGACRLCAETRVFCTGCRDGREVMTTWFGYKPEWAACQMMMLCPLCLGEDYAYESVWRERFPEEDDQDGEDGESDQDDDVDIAEDKMTSLDIWVREREVELGHRASIGYMYKQSRA